VANHTLGVWLDESGNNIMSGNVISKNSDDGAWLSDSNCNIISENIFLNNGDPNVGTGGLDIYNSKDNLIYHNDFIDNYKQAYVLGSSLTNTWDNGYPSGGNYWSDFDEPSEGAYDNNSDGIVDSSYTILGGGNQDRYPLMSPWGEDGNSILSIHPTSHNFGNINVRDTADRNFYIENTGEGTLSWSVDESIPWASVSPTSGTTTSETDTITIHVDTTGLEAGQHYDNNYSRRYNRLRSRTAL